MGTEHTATTGAKLLVEKWSARLLHETSEERIVSRGFMSPDGSDVHKIGSKLHMPKVSKITATKNATSGIDLTYTAPTEGEVYATPVWAYGAVEINRAVYNRTKYDLNPAYKEQIKYGLVEAFDGDAGALAASLATNVRGSSLADADKGLLLDAHQSMLTSCKRKMIAGQTKWYLTFHPTQSRNLLNIFDFTASNVMGGGTPLRTGWYSEILRADLAESGNVYQSGGITHNLGYIDETFGLAFNEEPFLLDPQPFEMVMRLIGTCEYAVYEQWDEYGVDIQTR